MCPMVGRKLLFFALDSPKNSTFSVQESGGK
jgi:hypothetical protein